MQKGEVMVGVKSILFVITLATGLSAQTTVFGVSIGQPPTAIAPCPKDNHNDQICLDSFELRTEPPAEDWSNTVKGTGYGMVLFYDREINFETLDGNVEFMEARWSINSCQATLEKLAHKLGPPVIRHVPLVNGLGIESKGLSAMWYRKDAVVRFNQPYLPAGEYASDVCGVTVQSHKWLRYEAKATKTPEF
jgi:hypothetical protein